MPRFMYNFGYVQFRNDARTMALSSTETFGVEEIATFYAEFYDRCANNGLRKEQYINNGLTLWLIAEWILGACSTIWAMRPLRIRPVTLQ